MERTLSSALTPIAKFFPGVWIPAFGVGAFSLWLAPDRVVYNGVQGGAPAGAGWWFLAIWAVGAAVLWRVCVPLKRVTLVGDVLHVSNYVRKAIIPLIQVERVTQLRFLSPRPVTLHLRGSSPFGQRITFVPATASRFAAWREDPIVAELRALTSGSPAG